jgi:hypothetical protein
VAANKRDNELGRLRRAPELLRLWRHENQFARTFARAARTVLHSGSPSTDADADARAFLENVVVRIVSRPADLVTLCNMVGDERIAREFMRFFVRHPLVDFDVIFALVETPSIFKALPDDPQWMEVAVLIYGTEKLNENEGRKLAIAEFAPLGIDVERPTVRSLVGSAFDAGMLADDDRRRLLELFPGDAYFRATLMEEQGNEG